MCSLTRSSEPAGPPIPQRPRRPGPIFALLLLAPVISEVLYGATRLSAIFALVPQILTWGCGALIIREGVRRWHKGWEGMLLLGLALAVAEECVIQQTSLAPWGGLAREEYGRVGGVNWVYLIWALGYESVWVVLIPVHLTELLFPARRGQLWLRGRGLVIASVTFALGSLLAWYGWTQQARVQVFHLPRYDPPVAYILLACGTILALVLAADRVPTRRPEAVPLEARRSTPTPWRVGLAGCLLGTPWSAFVLVAFGWLHRVPFEAALAAGLSWAVLAIFLARRWTSSSNWSDPHRLAVVIGGIIACMLGGFVVFKVGGASRVDWIGKSVLNLVAVVWLCRLAWKRRAARSSGFAGSSGRI